MNLHFRSDYCGAQEESATINSGGVNDGDTQDTQEIMRKKYGRNNTVPRRENVKDLKRTNQEVKRRFKNKQVQAVKLY